VPDVNEDTELNIEAINGHILVKKHMENKVIIRTTVKSLLTMLMKSLILAGKRTR